MINLYALLLLLTAAVCTFLGLTVRFLNRKSLVNKLFMMGIFVIAYWAFGLFMMHQASDIETASFWNRILFMWPFLAALVAHFALAFTEREIAKKKITYVLLYVPALFFSLTDLLTDLISAVPVMEPWGYTYVVPADSLIANATGIWTGALLISAIALLVWYYYNVTEHLRKQQTKFVAIGLAIPVVFYILTDMAFFYLGVQVPGLGSIAGGIFSGLMFYAIWKYDLFTLNPVMAAENIVSTMPDSLVLADVNGKILSVNPSLVEFTGYQQEEIIGKPLSQLATDKTKIDKMLTELLGKREIKNYEIKCLTKAGVEKSVTISGSVVRNQQGEDVGINCIIHDITQQKLMEQKLVKAERYASIGELAGMIGHDLRNPLTSIQGATFYLKRKYQATSDSKVGEMFETIENSVEYSNKIINDLLDYSREVTLEREVVSLNTLISNALSLVQKPETIQVINSTEGFDNVSVDKGKITRVIVNLITNAFEAMPRGGTLRITSHYKTKTLLLAFTDTGTGIPAEVVGNIWKPLFTTKAKGMGFGLAICKRIVDAHGGKIWAESTVGKGTTFSIELPRFS